MILLSTDARDLEHYEADILALAVGAADAARMAQVVSAYELNDAWSLYVYRPNAKTLGIIGCEVLDALDARIQHIAVNPVGQRRGIGRLMIEAAAQELGFNGLRAETDSDAVEFYSACGFKIESLGEKYPGVERFECTLRVGA